MPAAAVAVGMEQPMGMVAATRPRGTCTAVVPRMPELFMDRAEALMGMA